MNAIVPTTTDEATVDFSRKTTIIIAGQEHELLFTTLAVKQIGVKYGGIDKIGDKLTNTENWEEKIDDIIWLIKTLLNQPIMIYNLYNPDDKRDLWTEEKLELLTDPASLSGFSNAILEAFQKGTKSHISTTENDNEKKEGKNAVAE